MYVERHTVSITTATGGGATGYTPVVTGTIAAIIYTKDGTTPFASTADITVTTETTGQTLWSESNVNATKSVYPAVTASTTSGGASTVSEFPLFAASERVKVVIAQGGNTKLGSFKILVA